jgi:hypothetical protein
MTAAQKKNATLTVSSVSLEIHKGSDFRPLEDKYDFF